MAGKHVEFSRQIFTKMERRVVITGIGVVSPIGNDLDTFWSNLIAGKSGVSRIDDPKLAGYDCQIAGQVRGFEAGPYFTNAKDARRADPFAQLGMAASVMAMQDSGVDLTAVDLDRFGCMVGSGIGSWKNRLPECLPSRFQ